MARISKASKQAATETPAKGTKVGRVSKAAAKSAQQAPAAKGKADKAAKPARAKSASSQQRARIAAGTIKLTPEDKAHTGYRGARGECWQLVVANNGKPVSNVVGQTYAGRNGSERAFDTSFIAFFRDEGLVTVE